MTIACACKAGYNAFLLDRNNKQVIATNSKIPTNWWLAPNTKKRSAYIPFNTVNIPNNSRVGKGISAQASHRTVRDSLPSYGSCYTITFV